MRATRVMALVVLLVQAACSDDSNGTPDAGKEVGPPDGPLQDGPPPCTHPAVKADCKDDWCAIPAGCFWMGSPTTESCREQCWVPPCPKETRHAVTLSHGFEIKATEVTQGQFLALMGYNPSYYLTGPDSPVEMVSWHEAALYCNVLSKHKGLTPCYDCTVDSPDAGVPDAAPKVDAAPSDGGTPVDATAADATAPDTTPTPDGGATYWRLARCETATAFEGTKTIHDCPGYRLPTEAEWEYAYRAGSETALHNGKLSACSGNDPGADAIAWYGGNSSKVTHPVGGKKANDWGVHDMAGNVWEWCQDRNQIELTQDPVTDPTGPATGDRRLDRGGSCWSQPQYLRAALRDHNLATDRFDYIGLRPVRSK